MRAIIWPATFIPSPAFPPIKTEHSFIDSHLSETAWREKIDNGCVFHKYASLYNYRNLLITTSFPELRGKMRRFLSLRETLYRSHCLESSQNQDGNLIPYSEKIRPHSSFSKFLSFREKANFILRANNFQSISPENYSFIPHTRQRYPIELNTVFPYEMI
jgi:hypothetical protein